MPLYAATLLLSAFLLFLVQPLFGKMILPLLGGSPQVWNTAMLFFQALLLAGYAYAHAIARFLSIRMQAALHLALLVLFIFVLPIAVPEGWSPPVNEDPTLWQLGLMFVAVGGPFFVLSGSAPLLQHWFAHTRHEDAHNPYFLYAASNLGSMSALIAYPFFVEPALKISDQSLAWAGGYGLLIMLVTAAALLAAGHGKTDIVKDSHETETITWQRRGLWLMLAFVPSSLMLGVTTFITTDLASVPLLWIGPLALYVSTFIIAFAKRPFPSHRATLRIQAYLFMALLLVQYALLPFDKMFLIGLHLAVFFFTALMCHQELSASKPHAGHLTQFYLIMALGGALGGFFNAIIAPNLFTLPLEYGLALALSAFMRFSSDPGTSIADNLNSLRTKASKSPAAFLAGSGLPFVLVLAFFSYLTFFLVEEPKLLLLSLIVPVLILPLFFYRRWGFGFCALAILLVHPPGHNEAFLRKGHILFNERNFFGVIKVVDDRQNGLRLLLHGTTNHGTQALAAEYKLQRLAYYSDYNGVGDAFALADGWPTPQNVAVLGLGVGVAACFQKAGRHFDFFEIDPAVVDVAENPDLFTYLSDCGSPYDIILGDARLQIGNMPDHSYDIIFLDVFSSDNIPVHVLTNEAMATYQQKLKDDGLIVANISNRHLDLKPVLAVIAKSLDLRILYKYSQGGTLPGTPLSYNSSEYVVLTANAQHVADLKDKGWQEPVLSEQVRLWTDQYSDIVSTLKILSNSENLEPFIN